MPVLKSSTVSITRLYLGEVLRYSTEFAEALLFCIDNTHYPFSYPLYRTKDVGGAAKLLMQIAMARNHLH